MLDDSVTIARHLKAEPELRQVYARMGFKPHRAEIPAGMLPLVKEAIALGHQLVQPVACFIYHPIKPVAPDTAAVESAFTIKSRKVYGRVAGCQGIYLMAVTIGLELDRRVSELSRAGDVTRAFLLNAYGSEAAEALLEALNREIARNEEARGMTTTKRYSPGYGDWPITAQRELLGHLNAERIGIHLTETCLMIPEKSVSAIIGVKPG